MKGVKKGDLYMFTKIYVPRGNDFLRDKEVVLLEPSRVYFDGKGRKVKIYGSGWYDSITLEFPRTEEAQKFINDLDDTGKAEATAKVHY